MSEKDIIAAIASAAGLGAIGVVRVSGDGAEEVLKRVFFPVQKFESHKMYYGKVCKNGEVIDECMCCFFKSPRSFTCEDSFEIYAHGGMFVLGAVLGAVIENGARLAEPGEFTKRAFLNGRINLTQAEAVADLISAKNDAARRAALRQLGGGLSSRVGKVRDRILLWLAHIELSIDYPEHEEEARNASEILSEGSEMIADLRGLLETAEVGRVIREGVRTAIIGRPNVGKSTLLNAILHEDRAIVHEAAGTTRDVLMEEVRVGDVPLVIMDTAGLRETGDPVEAIGIEKTRETVANAELILYVADAMEGLIAEDLGIIEGFGDKPVIVLMNKSDLHGGIPLSASIANLEMARGAQRRVPALGHSQTQPLIGVSLAVSAKTGEGMNELFACIRKLFFAGNVGAGGESDMITRHRHRVLIASAIEHVEKAMRGLADGVPEDLVSVSLRAAYIALGEILGVEIDDDIVDRIFSEFCVGK